MRLLLAMRWIARLAILITGAVLVVWFAWLRGLAPSSLVQMGPPNMADPPVADGQRDPYRQPFTNTSPWNHPIGDGAIYVAAGIERPRQVFRSTGIICRRSPTRGR